MVSQTTIIPALALLLFAAIAGCVDNAPADPLAPTCPEGASLQRVDVHGSVVDEGFLAVSGARVLIGSHETTSTDNGAWAIDGLLDGCTYQYLVSHPDCEGVKGYMQPSAKGRTFILPCGN